MTFLVGGSFRALWVGTLLFACVLFTGVVATGQTIDKSTEALIAASKEGQLDVVNRLIRQGANVNAKSEVNQTPLIAAAGWGHLQSTVHSPGCTGCIADVPRVPLHRNAPRDLRCIGRRRRVDSAVAQASVGAARRLPPPVLDGCYFLGVLPLATDRQARVQGNPRRTRNPPFAGRMCGNRRSCRVHHRKPGRQLETLRTQGFRNHRCATRRGMTRGHIRRRLHSAAIGCYHIATTSDT